MANKMQMFSFTNCSCLLFLVQIAKGYVTIYNGAIDAEGEPHFECKIQYSRICTSQPLQLMITLIPKTYVASQDILAEDLLGIFGVNSE